MCDAHGKNALSEEFVAELTGGLQVLSEESNVKVVVLLGMPEVFCSGAPKSLLLQLADGGIAPSDILLPKVILSIPLPLVAAMEGHAVGGGFALGLCADFVIISRESRYGCNFIDLGITPGMGTTRLLEQVLSPAIARELLYTGELRKGSEFETHSGFNYVLPRALVAPKAFEIASRIAEKPRSALETLKRGMSIRRRRIFEETFELETGMHRKVLSDPETKRRIREEYVE